MEVRERLAEERKLDGSIINLLRVAPKHALPMDVLRTAVSALSFYDPEFQKNDHDANVHKAIRPDIADRHDRRGPTTASARARM